MTEQRKDPPLDDPRLEDPEDVLRPEVDLQMGGEEDLSGSGEEGLAELDEENLYGNDVIVKGELDNRAPDEPADA